MKKRKMKWEQKGMGVKGGIEKERKKDGIVKVRAKHGKSVHA